MSTLVVALQPKALAFDSLSGVMQEELTAWIDAVAATQAERERLRVQVGAKLQYSPLTAQVASLVLYDPAREASVVYYVSEEKTADVCIGDTCHLPRTEKEILIAFWQGAIEYERFVTFNGRKFLLPFILHRSALLGITPTIDLLENRLLSRQHGVQHVDLLDQLTFDGVWERRPSLRMFCEAYGIPLPPTHKAITLACTQNDTATLLAAAQASVEAVAALYVVWQTHFESIKENDF